MAAPEEVSSKKRTPYKLPTSLPTKPKPRDPRFDEQAGELAEDHHLRNYAFVEKIRQNELAEIESSVKKLLRSRSGATKTLDQLTDEQREQYQALMKAKSLLITKVKSTQQKKTEMKRKAEWKKEEAAKVAEGKKPFFPKKTELKKQELVEKFNELKDKRQLNKWMEKRTKRVAQKQHVRMPRERRTAESREHDRQAAGVGKKRRFSGADADASMGHTAKRRRTDGGGE